MPPAPNADPTSREARPLLRASGSDGGDLDAFALIQADPRHSPLVAARQFLPVTGATLAVVGGTPRALAPRFSARSRRTSVLIAPDELTTSSYC